MAEQMEKPNYKKTLNLPKTGFPMKANLVQREPEMQKRWEKMNLYRQMREADHPRGRFTLHDGPPYANGDIHLGHLLNKVLKDLVVRSRTMLGFDVDFVPGWDCHGLPIEHKVLKENQSGASASADAIPPAQDAIKIRRQCEKYARKYVKLQAEQMKRLGTVGDYDNPYITMDSGYEAAVLNVFADLVSQGIVYRALKPVHWSIANQTALAEAELEYEQREDTSIYVLFELGNPQNVLGTAGMREDIGDEPVYLMIWTTTPWTLPANLAVAVLADATYRVSRVSINGSEKVVVAADKLAPKIFEVARVEEINVLGGLVGREFEHHRAWYKHPFIDDGNRRPVVLADYVTLEDGTGLVHTAPGHGSEDYQTGRREGLDIYCPVRDDGTFDHTAPDRLVGKSVWEGNDLVVERLRESGHLFHDEPYPHSYPHDWRSKTPVIFRATEQWFIAVDDAANLSLRDKATKAADGIRFIPEWGRARLRGMLETRPDWCISRQRSWGLPIPALLGPEPGQVLLTKASVRAVAQLVGEKGSDVWFVAPPEDLLIHYDPANDPEAPDWVSDAIANGQLRKGTDIFDVWFESGSSWAGVLEQRDIGHPADLYLEGSDQHRGWFQASLLASVGARQQSPFKAVLTHGFIVDKDGRKMSKSEGNALSVQDLMRDFGADVCRWWVATLNFVNDIKADPEFFATAGEAYRKIRNTIRFLLSNLNDFDPTAQRRPLTEADRFSVDAWAVRERNRLVEKAAEAYEQYNYRAATERIFNFCNDTMSAVYLAAVKDRLYCDKPDSDRRRRTQTVLFDTADAVIRLIAPVLVHTAEEAWSALHGDEATSVHVQPLVVPTDAAFEGDWPDADWPTVINIRDRALKAVESARAERDLDNPLDVGIVATVNAEQFVNLQPFEPELADLLGVSRFHLAEGAAESFEVLDLRDAPRCDRSWKRDETVKPRRDGGMLTDRDAEAVGGAAAEPA